MEMSNAFSEIFRPRKPEQLIGQSQASIAKSLLERVKKGEILQEILFSGSSGIGKTTISKMYVSSILGDDYQDYWTEINCSAETGIDNIRQIIERIHYLPLGAEYTVFYLDEIHGLSKSAQNALLAEIEPLPSHVIMIASTTDPSKLIPTLRSRFTEYKLQIPTTREFQKKAQWIINAIKRDKPEIEVSNDLRDEIIAISNGNIRTFDRYFQQVIDGSYKGVENKVEDETSLLHHVFYNNSQLSDWFNAANKEPDYIGSSIGLSTYSIKVLSNPKYNGAVANKARLILKIFGQGLSQTTQEKVSFYAKLLELYEELHR